jgi:hypothetical protein
MMNAKLNELEVNGTVRIYNEEMNVKEVMTQLESLLNADQYNWGWVEDRNGNEYVEIVKFEE